MDEIIIKGKKASYSIRTEAVPPNPPDKVQIDAPIDFIAVNTETNEEEVRHRVVFMQGYSNADLQRELEYFKASAAEDFGKQ
jgi:hypothetical protein